MIIKLLISILSLTNIGESVAIPLKLIISLLLFSFSFYKNPYRINELFPKLIIAVIIINTINVFIQFIINPELKFSINLLSNAFSRNNNINDQSLFYILENRNFTINLIFSFALYLYLRAKDIKYILSIIYYSVIINSIFGITQLVLNGGRIELSFREPSSSGYYYCFVFFIIMHFFTSGNLKILRNIFIPLGVLIFSKAQYISFAIWSILKCSIKIKSIVIIIFLIITLVSINNNEIIYFKTFMNSFTKNGFKGLTSDEDVKDSYIVRISGIYFGTKTLIKYPFGVGYNGFSILYNKIFSEDSLSQNINSWEINYILESFTRASPKSNIINFIVSIGIFSLLIFYKIFNYFQKLKHVKYLYNSFILLVLVSFFAELNPMWIYFMFLFIFGEIELANQKDEQIYYPIKQ